MYVGMHVRMYICLHACELMCWLVSCNAHLYKEQVELHRVVTVHILVREKEFLTKGEDSRLLNTLFSQRLVWV